jgi:hypothetical protein
MVYQVVAKQRTGSTIVNLFALKHNNNFGFTEFFLGNHIIHTKVVHRISYVAPPDTDLIEQKFYYLEKMKDQDVHFSLKVIPHNLLLLGYEKRLISYLKDYNIVTINRDPFETFLSWSYQKATRWVTPHNTKTLDPKEIYYNIKLIWIKEFIDRWTLESRFIDKLDATVIDYKDLSIKYLQNFFQTDFNVDFKPMGIQYRNYIRNISEVEHYFYKSLNHVE